MNLTQDNAAPANGELRSKSLVPGMAQTLATSPVSLHSPSDCYDLLVVQYRASDVLALLSEAIRQAHQVRARAA